MGLYEIYQEELERITAIERLELIESIAAGNGMFDKNDYRRFVARLQREARRGLPQQTQAADAATLEAMGIEVVTVKKNG